MESKTKALGHLPLPLKGDKQYLVAGGPFTACPTNMIGVKMAAEIRRECHINIPTQDFKTPDPAQLTAGLLQAIKHITKGDPLYVGCFAGRGRTGLFMAVLAKAFGVAKPVEYVREHYYPHAVETDEQYQFVMNFPVPPQVKWMLRWARAKTLFSKRTLLTNAPD